MQLLWTVVTGVLFCYYLFTSLFSCWCSSAISFCPSPLYVFALKPVRRCTWQMHDYTLRPEMPFVEQWSVSSYLEDLISITYPTFFLLEGKLSYLCSMIAIAIGKPIFHWHPFSLFVYEDFCFFVYFAHKDCHQFLMISICKSIKQLGPHGHIWSKHTVAKEPFTEH